MNISNSFNSGDKNFMHINDFDGYFAEDENDHFIDQMLNEVENHVEKLFSYKIRNMRLCNKDIKEIELKSATK